MAPPMGMPTAMTGAPQVHYQTVQVDERRKPSLSSASQMPPMNVAPAASYASAGLTSTPPPPPPPAASMPPMTSAAVTPAPPPPVFDSHEGTPQLPPPPVLETSTIDLDTNSPPPPPPPPEAFGNLGGVPPAHVAHLPPAPAPQEAELPPPPPMGLGPDMGGRAGDVSDGQPYHTADMPPAPMGGVEDPMTGEMENCRAKAGHDPAWAPAYYLSKVITLYEYVQDKDDELTFGENQIIYVVKKNDDGWWEGVMNGLTGLFPGNYVEPCD